MPTTQPTSEATPAARGEPDAGSSVGPWRLLRVLGRGGMGAVWLAERSDRDFHQFAALKLIKLGMDSAEILQRFVIERRILARLEHPNIARLIDGGVDASGRPWFAMEWVDGPALVDYANAHGLDAAARVRLFLKLCDAVAHAHRQLVVHRDLKPGNILVDARGEPRLLDFGIAKLLESDPLNDTSATGARYFTRAYAAPEQVRGEPVSTATDIYALGAVLFELLTGTALHQARLTTSETRDLLSLARRRAGDLGPAAVNPRALGGDLALVVARAVRAEPQRRYPSVEAFAEDLRAWLDGRPVRARPDSLGYRLGRFVRRHWIGVSSSVAVALAVLAGATLALWQARIARQEALRAEAVSEFLSQVFESATPEGAPGGEITAKSLLERGSQRIANELAEEPAVRARLHASLAKAWYFLGDYARAAEMYEAGRALAAEDDWRAQVALLRGLAQAELGMGQVRLARTHIDQASARLPADDAVDARRERALTLQVAKSISGAEGDRASARRQAETVYREFVALFGADDERTLVALNDLGNWSLENGDAAGALAIFERTIEARQRVSGFDHPELAVAMHNRVLALLALGRIEDARAGIAEVVELRRRILPPGHRDLPRSLGVAANIESRRGDLERARALRGEALALLREQPRPDQLLLGSELTNLGVDSITLGRYGDAREELAESLERLLPLLGATDERVLSAGAYLSLAEANLGELQAAEERLRAILREQGSQAAPVLQLPPRRYLARVLRWSGRAREAVEVLAPMIARLESAAEASATARVRAFVEHALSLLETGATAEAGRILGLARSQLGALESADGAQWRLAQARLHLASGRPSQAGEDAAAAHATLARLQGEEHSGTAEARALLALARWRASADAGSRAALEAALAWYQAQRPWHPDAGALREALAR